MQIHSTFYKFQKYAIHLQLYTVTTGTDLDIYTDGSMHTQIYFIQAWFLRPMNLGAGRENCICKLLNCTLLWESMNFKQFSSYYLQVGLAIYYHLKMVAQRPCNMQYNSVNYWYDDINTGITVDEIYCTEYCKLHHKPSKIGSIKNWLSCWPYVPHIHASVSYGYNY